MAKTYSTITLRDGTVYHNVLKVERNSENICRLSIGFNRTQHIAYVSEESVISKELQDKYIPLSHK